MTNNQNIRIATQSINDFLCDQAKKHGEEITIDFGDSKYHTINLLEPSDDEKNEIVQKMGFESVEEYNEIVKKIVFTSPQDVERILNWKAHDGTKEGLLKILNDK
jgi:hypothetical protein